MKNLKIKPDNNEWLSGYAQELCNLGKHGQASAVLKLPARKLPFESVYKINREDLFRLKEIVLESVLCLIEMPVGTPPKVQAAVFIALGPILVTEELSGEWVRKFNSIANWSKVLDYGVSMDFLFDLIEWSWHGVSGDKPINHSASFGTLNLLNIGIIPQLPTDPYEPIAKYRNWYIESHRGVGDTALLLPSPNNKNDFKLLSSITDNINYKDQ